jgi:two-component system LytT family response regulator
MKLRTLIVEDEPLSQYYLGSLLKHLPQVEVVAKAGTEEEAITAIQSLKPDLVFLDIELHSGTGFEVLRKTQPQSYSVVFTTALEQQAIKIIKLSGVPFLQKPIDAEELARKVNDVQKNREAVKTSLAYLLQTLHRGCKPYHMALHGEKGLEYAELEQIVYVTAESGTVFHLQNGVRKTDTRPFKEIEALLTDFGFFRVSAAHMVHLHNLKNILPGGDKLLLSDGSIIPLSPKRHAALATLLKQP